MYEEFVFSAVLTPDVRRIEHIGEKKLVVASVRGIQYKHLSLMKKRHPSDMSDCLSSPIISHLRPLIARVHMKITI